MNFLGIVFLFTFYVQATSAPIADASMRGSVVRLGTIDTLSKAKVELRTTETVNKQPQSTTTAEDGKFLFRNVLPGQYQIVVNRSGYVSSELTLTLAPGEEKNNLQISLTPTGAISGRVLDRSGQPLINADVQAMRLTYESGRRTLKFVRSVRTNDLGEYRLFWLAPGRYYVSALHPDAGAHRLRDTSLEEIERLSGGPRMTMIFGAASPASVIAGRYSRTVSPTYVPIFFPDTMDEHTATMIDVTAAADIDHVDITVSPVPLVSIRGTIVDSVTGRTARSARLVVSRDPPLTNSDPYPGVDPTNGSFEVRRVLPGSYTLFATAGDLTGQAAVQVDDVDVEDVTIAVQPQIGIRGRIVVEGKSENDNDLSTLRVNLRESPDKPNLNLSEPKDNGVPLDDGSFSVRTPRGDYQLDVTFPASRTMYVKSAQLGTADALSNGVHIDGPVEGSLEIVLGTNPGAVEGRVHNAMGALMDGVTVALIPETNHRSRLDLYRVTSTDGSGGFRIERIAPGNYKLFAWNKVENGAWTDSEFIRSYEDLGAPIRVVEGAQESIDLNVIVQTP